MCERSWYLYSFIHSSGFHALSLLRLVCSSCCVIFVAFGKFRGGRDLIGFLIENDVTRTRLRFRALELHTLFPKSLIHKCISVLVDLHQYQKKTLEM